MSAPDILGALDDPALFGSAFADASWRPWRAVLACLFGLPLDEGQRELVASCTGRTDLPAAPFREAWLIVGRRAGKSRSMALLGTWLACFRDWRPHLSPGETATVAVIAADRAQARIVHRYVRGLVTGHPLLAPLVVAEGAERIELANRTAIEVFTASSVRVRGYTLCAALLDELAYWPSDDAADPDAEIIAALRPALATLPGSLLVAASSPHARRGELWRAFQRHHGREGAPGLVWWAPSAVMNPTLDPGLIADELERDPDRAAAEWLARWRIDVERFVGQEAIAAAVVPGRHELPPVAGVGYVGFCDPSGGSVDSMTLGIAHAEDGRVILDAAREVRAPFSPDSATAELAALAKLYGLARVTGDKYGGAWPGERFAAHGITYEPAAKAKSDLYLELLPLLNSMKVELLDQPRLLAQLGNLERRTSRSGKDSVDHGPGAHDDVANAAAGALTLAAGRGQPIDLAAHLILGAPLEASTMFAVDDWRRAFTPNPGGLSW